MLIEQIISEKYVNAVGYSDSAQQIKQQYADQVWDLLQKSYAAIGGIKGKGFSTKEEMLSLPMWKMGIRDGVVHAVIMYKDKGGRKSVAIGSDGSPQADWFIVNTLKNEFSRSYGEKSKAALGKVMKLFPYEALEPFLVSPEKVAQMFPDADITPIQSLDQSEWPADAQMTLTRYPELLDYGYMRDISGNWVFKVMIGTPGKNIT